VVLLVQIAWPRPQAVPERADAILCLGAGMADDASPRPDEVTRARARTCADLHAGGAAPVVIFTGAGNDNHSAAEAMAHVARTAGLPPEAAIIEPRAHSTLQNAAFGLALCAHAALGLVLAAPDGRAGAEGAQARAVAALAPAEATALMAAWSTPPTVGMAATAPPRPDTSGESSPSRPTAPSDGPPRHTAAALPVPAPPAAPPAPASRLPLPVALADSTAPPAPAPRLSLERPQHVAGAFSGGPARPAMSEPPVPPPADARPVAHAPPRPQAAERPSETTARPRPRPEHQAASADVTPTPAGAKQTARDASAASPARGTGGQGTETAETRRLKAAWAGAIGARIARAQRHPGAGHGSGRVRVTLVVARDGRLAEVRVAASSGSEGLDLAAIAAVRRAAPFPQAPGALPDEWVRFGQWVAFR